MEGALSAREYTVLCPFGGLGGGALGFLAAEVRLLGVTARFRCLGSIDSDPLGCADFEMLTGSPAWCVDVDDVTPLELRQRHPKAPDCVFLSPPCLPGNGLVLTELGPRRIDSIRANDLVLTHKGRFRPVLKVGCHEYDGELHGFRLQGSVDTQWFTSEHPMWMRRPGRSRGKRMLHAPRFSAAEKIRVGDRIGFPVEEEQAGCAHRFIAAIGDPQLAHKGGRNSGRYAKSAHTARLRRVRDLTRFAHLDALWFLLGVYIGDGYRVPAKHEVNFCVGATDSDLAKRVRTALGLLGLRRFSEDRAGGRTNVKIRVSAKHLCAIAGRFGDGAENKDIPPELMGLERPLLDALIDGCRASDGSEQETQRRNGKLFSAAWKIVSVSLPLLRSLQRLLLRRREFGAIHVAWAGGPQVIMGRTVQTLPRWEIKVSEATRKRSFAFEDDAVWVRVRKVESKRVLERVWNLEVQEDNTFCAPLMATHNCKGASGLLSSAKAKTAKYQRMNGLAERWVETMLAAWHDELPRIVLFENVPRLKQRAGAMLKRVRSMLRKAGYVLHDGFHDCGELGGLAQKRKRYLLVARLQKRVPSLLYQPPVRRVRGCGEVLEQLPIPLPGSTLGGPLHRLPRLSWLNWVRLALIPAGGDWRDLDGVLRDGQARREVFKRHGVQDWSEPTGTVAGSGSNGPSAVADPRLDLGTDLRIKTGFDHGYGVLRWNEPSSTVAGGSHPGQGAYSVADVRAYGGAYGVLDWSKPIGAVCGETSPTNGRFSVAEIRFKGEYYRGTYGVLSWEQAAGTITGNARVDCGRFCVADPRKPPSDLPIIVAADGTWHRPLTTLELAALQGLPTEVGGEPLALAGKSVSGWRERIGNAVPPPAATAIAERMLVALVESDLGAMALASTNTPVWVEREAVLQ